MALTASQRYWAGIVTVTFGGETFKCSRRTRSALYKLRDDLKVRFPNANGPGKPAYVKVFQGCFQDPDHVPASKGTHDYDACLDIRIVGITWSKAQAFTRWRGWFSWWRKRSEGPWIDHIHMGLLPPGIAVSHPNAEQVGNAYIGRGLKVGTLVDGGKSSTGRTFTSSQAVDYLANPPRNGMKGHAIDYSPRPTNPHRYIFKPKGY